MSRKSASIRSFNSGAPHRAGKKTDKRGQPGNQSRVLREGILDHIAIADRSGLYALRKEGTAAGGTAQLTAVFPVSKYSFSPSLSP